MFEGLLIKLVFMSISVDLAVEDIEVLELVFSSSELCSVYEFSSFFSDEALDFPAGRYLLLDIM